MAATKMPARKVYAAFAPLFEAPDDRTVVEAEHGVGVVGRAFPEAGAAFAAFAREIATLTEDAREELYLRTFAVAPSCIPYVGVHIYGEESFKRGELMAHLNGGFEAHEFRPEGELPDHVAVLLRFTAFLDDEELSELEAWLLTLPVQAMSESMAGTRNPYRFLVESLETFVTRNGVPDVVRETLASQAHEPDADCSSCGVPTVAVNPSLTGGRTD